MRHACVQCAVGRHPGPNPVDRRSSLAERRSRVRRPRRLADRSGDRAQRSVVWPQLDRPVGPSTAAKASGLLERSSVRLFSLQSGAHFRTVKGRRKEKSREEKRNDAHRHSGCMCM
jgi:hypothetical protein